MRLATFTHDGQQRLGVIDPATDTLSHHQAIRDSGWEGRILPTFRPDGVINIDAPRWDENIATLGS